MKRFALLLLLVLAGLACAAPLGARVATAGQAPSSTPTLAAPSPASRPAQIPTLPPSSTPAVCLVDTGFPGGHVNLRSGPGMRFPVLAVATAGEMLTLTGRADPAGWAEVRTKNGLLGWFYISTWCKK